MYREIIVHEPRDWKPGLETIELPKSAILSDGALIIKAHFTKRLRLSFAGILQGIPETKYSVEVLTIKSAVHTREGDVSPILSSEDRILVQMIPGDSIQISFSDPVLSRDIEKQETYLMQSSGFYTALREPYRKLAGNWAERLSEEAKKHYRELTELTHYS